MNHPRKGQKGRTSPVIEYVRSLGNYRTTSEVAEELQVSPGLIRKLSKRRVTQAPSFVAPYGDTHVNLYTQEDVEALRDYINRPRVVIPRDEFDEKDD